MSFLTSDEQPIISLCSPSGHGAVALLRLSGVGSFQLTENFSKLSSGKKLTAQETHTIHHGHIFDETEQVYELVDEVLFFLMRAPRTYTGQETVEITCHNNQMIIDKIMNVAISFGARAARAGEYTQRAFLSGKLDLSKAEAVHDVVTAQTQEALKRSMLQLHGSLSQHLAKIEKLLTELTGLFEVSFEFLEEEQDDINFKGMINNKIEQLSSFLKQLESSSKLDHQIRNGVKVAITGKTNAGKSTLFNKILGIERAIVSDIHGTTRDHIVDSTVKNNQLWSLVDTAGIRETEDKIEKIGITRAKRELEDADVIILVVDATENPDDVIPENQAERTIVVFNKSDLKKNPSGISVSAKTGHGVEELIKIVSEKISFLIDEKKAPFLLGERQKSEVKEIAYSFSQIKKKVENDVDFEIIAALCRELLRVITGLTGRDIDRQVTDAIFKSFCIGK